MRGKKKLTTKFYVPERGTDALYKFFKDENLRFYLHDVIGPKSVIKGGEMQYNPLVVYLIYKHNTNFLRDVSWWTKNKYSVQAKQVLNTIVVKWNEEHEEKLSHGNKVREMVMDSYDKWGKNPDANFPRYFQFECGGKLDDFFENFFPDDKVEENVIEELDNDSHMFENSNGFTSNLIDDGDVDMTNQNIDSEVINECDIDHQNGICLLSNDDTSGIDHKNSIDYLNNEASDIAHSNGICLSAYEDDVDMTEQNIASEIINEFKKPSSLLDFIDNEHNYAKPANYYLQKIKANELKKSSPKAYNFMCEQCGTRFIIKTLFVKHMKDKHNIFICSKCSSIFSSANEFVQHMNNEHNSLTWHLITCDFCGEELARCGKTSVPHMDRHQRHTCKIDNCGKNFPNSNHLQSHQRSFHRGKGYFSNFKTLITCQVCHVRFDSVAERKEHAKVHLNKLCDTCQLYTISNVTDCVNHRKNCSPGQKLEMEKDFVEEMQNAFAHLKNQDLQSSAGSSKTKHTKALFIGSILYKADVLGNVEFHDLDGYPLWREDLHAPMYGSYSYNSSKLSTNAERNHNIMRPHFFKVYMHDIFPIGSTVLIKFNSLLRLPEYSFQLFDLKLWKSFKASGTSMKRSKFPFKKNFELPHFMQKTPELYGNNVDRGHLTPYYMACSIEDQQFFQLQGNIFPQMAPMNRGKWKRLEQYIPIRMEAYGARFAHITTACVYARDGNSFIMENGITKIESYFKVIFYTDDNGNVIRLNCFLVNQYPIPDDTVSEVTLYDIDSIKNNHLLYLNSHLLDTMPIEVLDYHRVSMKQHKASRKM